jgi:hypothetical protein
VRGAPEGLRIHVAELRRIVCHSQRAGAKDRITRVILADRAAPVNRESSTSRELNRERTTPALAVLDERIPTARASRLRSSPVPTGEL